MAEIKEFDNLDEFLNEIGANGIEISQNEAKKLVKKLQDMIYSNLTSSGDINPTSKLFDMFGSIDFDKTTNSFIVGFNQNAYSASIIYGSAAPLRFMPTLINYGYKDINYQNMNFYGYKGNLFITKAIEEFNKQYEKFGLYATFEVNGQDMKEMYPSNPRIIPYL